MTGTLTRLELAGIRVDQIAQLDAICLIWREIDQGTVSKTDAGFSNPSTITIFNGACFFAPIVSRRDRFDVRGEQQIYQNQYRILVPWTAFGIRIGDLIQVTTSEDDDLDLKTMVIKDVLLVSDISQRRLTAIDVKE